MKKGDNALALRYYHQSLKSSTAQGNPATIGATDEVLANYYINLKQADTVDTQAGIYAEFEITIPMEL